VIAGLVAVVILLVADVNIYISRGRVQERLSGSPPYTRGNDIKEDAEK
jgi:hypothetical protein